MVMLESTLHALRFLSSRSDDDNIDRLHYFLTSNVLIALSILISYKQFNGKPIECMTPKMFPDSWDEYAENYCFAQDTYKASLIDNIMPAKGERYSGERRISYYQWVPFFLLIQAVCFRLPSIFWQYLSRQSGIKMNDLIKLAADPRNIEPAIKENNLKSLTNHLQNALRFHRRMVKRQAASHKTFLFLNLHYSAFFISAVYLITKILFLVNVGLQLLFMNKFLETDSYSLYGFGAVLDIMNGTTWEQSNLFPRVTFCDFKVRAMGNVQDHSIQCVLVINMFNEKIFVFLWFWFMILFLLTIISLLYWFVLMVFPWPQRWFIVQNLQLSEMTFDPVASSKDVERFVGSYLKADGVFVLRMISARSGVIFGTELILSLWRNFYGLEQTAQKRPENQPLIGGRRKGMAAALAAGSGTKLNLRQRFKKVKTTDTAIQAQPSLSTSNDKLLQQLTGGGSSSGGQSPTSTVNRTTSEQNRPKLPPRPDKISSSSY